MRVDGRTSGAEVLRAWARAQDVELIGLLRETQLYVKAQERGLTLFDVAPAQVAADLAQWEGALQWLRPVLFPVAAPEVRREPVLPVVRRGSVLGARPLHPPPGILAQTG